MRLDLQRCTMVGGGRALRRVDSSPMPTLCRSDSIRKKKMSKRSRISAALRELRTAAKAANKDKDGLLQLIITGHRRGRRGSGAGGADDDVRTPSERGMAGPDDDDPQRALRLRLGRGVEHAGSCCELERPEGGTSSTGRRCASWALAVALVLALACVVALGKAPAICCCTCAAWWCGGAERSSQSACKRRIGAHRGTAAWVLEQRAGGTGSSTATSSVPCTCRHTG